MSAIEPEQTEPIELDPFDSKTSQTTLVVYGKSVGTTLLIALSAKLPCPCSRRPTPRTPLASPTEYGGKL